MKAILLILISFVSYELAKKIINRKILNKISKYFLEKNEIYYNSLLSYYEKNKKVKLKTRVNLINKINILIDKAGFREDSYCITNDSYIILYLIFYCRIYFCF